jgi:PAS domain S-box-containing protein
MLLELIASKEVKRVRKRGMKMNIAEDETTVFPKQNTTPRMVSTDVRFALLVDAVTDYAIFMLDPQGIVVSWNRGAELIKGYKPDEIIGQHFSTFYTKTANERHWPEEELRRACIHGRFEEEGWRVRKDGSLFWANVVITPVTDEQGRLSGFAKITRDMSERKRLEELESSRQKMNEFLATLAHELRNPLAPIRNAVSIMQMETNLSPTIKSCRGVIDRQLSQMTRLVDDLLDVGRITTGKITLQKDPVDLRDVLVRSIEACKPLFDGKNQVLQCVLPENNDIVTLGDLNRLTQVVQNLLNNASKFTPKLGVIKIAVEVENRTIALRIIDTGRGMTEEGLKECFELFIQEDAQINPTESGLGIGLTLARSITEMHGGAIQAFSDGQHKGSTFLVHLPRLMQADLEVMNNDELENSDRTCCNVLVVDDNRDSTDSMAMYVTLMGHETRGVYDGQIAIELAQTFVPDLVLLDLAMPDMDGFEVLQRLRLSSTFNHTTIVAMNGYGGEDARSKSLNAGFDDHLTKPVNPALLEKLLTACEEKYKRNT